ncbi:MAG: branched-chain amino acid transporter permease [Wolinella sp.]
MSHEYLIFATITASLATYLTRVLAFWILRDRTPNAWLFYLQRNMPLAIMTILIFYALKDVSWSESYGLRELGGIALSAISYLWLKNALLSIFSGVAFYMMAIHFI